MISPIDSKHRFNNCGIGVAYAPTFRTFAASIPTRERRFPVRFNALLRSLGKIIAAIALVAAMLSSTARAGMFENEVIFNVFDAQKATLNATAELPRFLKVVSAGKVFRAIGRNSFRDFASSSSRSSPL